MIFHRSATPLRKERDEQIKKLKNSWEKIVKTLKKEFTEGFTYKNLNNNKINDTIEEKDNEHYCKSLLTVIYDLEADIS